MPSITEIVDRARTIAEGRGMDEHQSPIIDSGMTAEALVPHAIRYVLERAAKEDIGSCFQEFDLADGDDMPEEILRSHLSEGYLSDLPHSSYIPPQDYGRSRFTALLTYWTARGNTFLYSSTGEVTLVVPAMPEISPSATAWIELPQRLIENAILTLAGALTGEIKIAELLGNAEGA